MNPWLLACLALLIPMIASFVVTFRGDTPSRVAGVEFGGIITIIMLMLLTEGLNRPDFLDIALALAVLAFGGGMVFARFLEGKL